MSSRCIYVTCVRYEIWQCNHFPLLLPQQYILGEDLRGISREKERVSFLPMHQCSMFMCIMSNCLCKTSSNSQIIFTWTEIKLSSVRMSKSKLMVESSNVRCTFVRCTYGVACGAYLHYSLLFCARGKHIWCHYIWLCAWLFVMELEYVWHDWTRDWHIHIIKERKRERESWRDGEREEEISATWTSSSNYTIINHASSQLAEAEQREKVLWVIPRLTAISLS